MVRQAYRASIFHLLGDPSDADAAQYFEDGVLTVENGHVAEVGAWPELAPRLEGVRVERFANGLIMPGFVDSHVHYPQVDIVASRGSHLLEWLSAYTFPTEARFQHKEIAAEAAQFFLDQLLRNGTTSALVFATVYKDSVDALFEAAQARNMRIITGKVLMDRNAPAGISDTAETGYQESRALIRAWHDKGRLGYAVTPRFALTSSERQLELAGRLLTEHPGVRLHTHLSENHEETAAVRRMFPDCPDYFAVYEKFGLATPQSVFAHCVHLAPGEWARFGKSGAAAAFCPVSNLFLGSGLFDLAAAEAVAARVGLGTDVGAGTSLSLFATMGDAYKVCQARRHSLDATKLFYMATLGGARVLGLDDKIGNFERGKEADFVVLDAAALPMLARRLAQATSPADRLFALAILADDRAVARTYLAGALAYSR
ncbi:MAG: guanine deaminase [Alphaproteobacteria bacterium]|nr:guanine deaminase [Alphaproteobacteria bacterium]MDE2110654.1 guanine deaminase [Alphaproteobacteria bacterium]MDE2495083.1 guanine deaminase [Alphaproteobacteria bacterium]